MGLGRPRSLWSLAFCFFVFQFKEGFEGGKGKGRRATGEERGVYIGRQGGGLISAIRAELHFRVGSSFRQPLLRVCVSNNFEA